MRFKYLLIPLLLLFAVNCFATEREMFGIGAFAGNTAGDTDGTTGKYKLNNSHGSDVSFGLETTGVNGYQLYGDYLFYRYDFLNVPEIKRPPFFGGGGQNITYSEDRGKNKVDKFSLAFPVGNEYLFWKPSVDAFLELVPVLSSTPDTKFQFGGGIGIKFLF
jgi:hypothetical protein